MNQIAAILAVSAFWKVSKKRSTIFPVHADNVLGGAS